MTSLAAPAGRRQGTYSLACVRRTACARAILTRLYACDSRFGQDLADYLTAVDAGVDGMLRPCVARLAHYDFTAAEVDLVCSVPGAFVGSKYVQIL